MKYDFDEIINRRGTCSYKWDSDPAGNIRPLWVADMDFRTAQPVIDALQKQVAHGIFGYTYVPDSYYQAVADWFERRHNWRIDRNSVIYTSGVVPALSAIIKALTVPGDKVLVQGPVYNCFFSSIRNNKCEIVSNSLVYRDLTYTMDFADLESKLADPKVKLMLLCNPHNPAGRVWTREELQRVGDLCHRYGVQVVSDEIHCELVYKGHEYTPFASLFPDAIVCVSATKTFNIAGLQIANIVCPDEGIRAKIDRAINDNEVCDVNPFGVIATQAAYNEGEEWLEQLLEYLYGNYRFMSDFCRENLPGFPLTKLEGTYLVWMDCRNVNVKSEDFETALKEATGLWLNAGSMYGVEGEGFMRWNIACPRKCLHEALQKFADFVKIHE